MYYIRFKSNDQVLLRYIYENNDSELAHLTKHSKNKNFQFYLAKKCSTFVLHLYFTHFNDM